MRKKKDKKFRLSLSLAFSLMVFVVLLATLVIVSVAVQILMKLGVIFEWAQYVPQVNRIIWVMIGVSLLIGIIAAFLTSRFSLRPINFLVSRMNRLAAGDFTARMDFKKPVRKLPVFKEISESFNTLAEELEQTEMLRSDFVNNFSHEFKTPIVSITGFAKLLRRGNLTDEEREQYLVAIEEESVRLAYMATNVLDLTKLENQAILKDISNFNLSEQVRACILLLENKWTRKNIELQVDFNEYIIEANEEMLKQIWINLIDNAIKFAPRCGTVSVDIREREGTLIVSVSNTGSEIPVEKQSKIFNKFYQADESHSSEGNGIGLAIVKRITELHRGQVSVNSGNGMTTFTVELPQTQ
ncbi:MAG: HAMP domain-containing histidine kinase [Clostridia bacterium]|nr:HAMP domain-containing histidine kinase [Clostridia bacterium]